MSRPETDPALSDHDQLFLFLSDALPVADSPSSFSLRHPESSDRDRDQNRIQAETMTENKTHVILLSCGSFNPITRGHVHMFGEGGGGLGGSKQAACLHLSCHVVEPNLHAFRFGVKYRRVRPERRVTLHQLALLGERALPRKHAQSHSNGCIPSSPHKSRGSTLIDPKQDCFSQLMPVIT